MADVCARLFVVNRFILTPYFLDQRLPTLDRLAKPGWAVTEPDLRGADQMARISDVHDALSAQVAQTGVLGQRVVSIGADCCQTLAVMAGLHRAGINPVLVWLDAHGDFNTWETSPSGFVGGMPLAMLVGRGDQQLLERLALRPMAEADALLSDARDLDPAEGVALQQSGVTHLARIDDLLASLPAGRPIYVHFDVDIIDAGEAPAMLYPVGDGPSSATLARVATALRQTGRLAAVSVTTWDLAADAERVTERACRRVLDALVADDGEPASDHLA